MSMLQYGEREEALKEARVIYKHVNEGFKKLAEVETDKLLKRLRIAEEKKRLRMRSHLR